MSERIAEPYPEIDASTDPSSVSVGQVIGEVTADLSKLMRQEMELAKAEMKVEAQKAGKGAGMMGAAGFGGYMLILFASLALMFALAEFLHIAVAALIVALIWGIVAAVAFSMGRKKLKQVNPKPQQTMETLKEDVEWAKHPTR